LTFFQVKNIIVSNTIRVNSFSSSSRRENFMSRSLFNVAALVLLCMNVLTACATIQLGTIPPPPSNTKMRIYVHPVTGSGSINSQYFIMPHEIFAAREVRRVEHYLRDTGIYSIVSREEASVVLKDLHPNRYQLERNDCELAKQLGKALYADYIMIVERTLEKKTLGTGEAYYRFAFLLINTVTGKKYLSWDETEGGRGSIAYARQTQMIEATYSKMFRQAKGDLLAAAVNKQARAQGSKDASATTPLLAPPKLERESTAASPPPVATPAPQKQPDVANLKDQKTAIPSAASAGKTKLVVFDLESAEQYKTIAHILTESLREELLLLNQFVLVNRENLQQVLQEQALQQTGLIDEQQSVKTGKGLAARQVVTGGLGLMGKTYVLQVKLIDVETYATLNLVSAKFTQGSEDEILNKMSDLAKKLVSRL
jgi:hypothetical protein